MGKGEAGVEEAAPMGGGIGSGSGSVGSCMRWKTMFR